MLRRRRRSPVLAELPAPRDGRRRPGSLARSELEAFTGLLEAVGDAGAVSVAGEGRRSAVAVGLATVAAVAGRRAALVECDLAAPTLAGSLGLRAAPGLGEYLRLEAEASQILQPMLLTGPASGGAVAPLVCVTAGAPSADGPGLLGSERFAHAVGGLRGGYDLVVLAGPALDREPDVLAVAAQVDRTLACCSKAPRSLGIRVDGFVVAP